MMRFGFMVNYLSNASTADAPIVFAIEHETVCGAPTQNNAMFVSTVRPVTSSVRVFVFMVCTIKV